MGTQVQPGMFVAMLPALSLPQTHLLGGQPPRMVPGEGAGVLSYGGRLEEGGQSSLYESAS